MQVYGVYSELSVTNWPSKYSNHRRDSSFPRHIFFSSFRFSENIHVYNFGSKRQKSGGKKINQAKKKTKKNKRKTKSNYDERRNIVAVTESCFVIFPTFITGSYVLHGYYCVFICKLPV